jgi:predicted TIM-barrel fold metal-dependent hydrolase
MIVDSLNYVGKSVFGPKATAEEIVSRLDDLEVDRAIVCPFKPQGYDLRAANETVADAVRRYPDRLIGFARADPWGHEQAIRDLDQAHGELGLNGLFLHPWEETFPIAGPEVDPLIRFAAERGLPVLIAAGYPWLSEGLQVGDLASRFPSVKFVATNGCQINISGLGTFDADFALARNPNLAIQTAGIYRQDFLEEVAARYGVGRLLYASNFPLMDPSLEILRVKLGAFDDQGKEAILGGNAVARMMRS